MPLDCKHNGGTNLLTTIVVGKGGSRQTLRSLCTVWFIACILAALTNARAMCRQPTVARPSVAAHPVEFTRTVRSLQCDDQGIQLSPTMITPIFDEIRARDLADWAGDAESERWMPSLLRLLALASGAKLRSCRFLTHEETNRGGWDGMVDAETEGFNVPAGLSAWEASKEKNVSGKAAGDAAKRSQDAGEVVRENCTLVHATLRVWPKKKAGTKSKKGKTKWLSSGEHKQAWEKAQARAGNWKSVRVLDAEDLAAGLARAPGVALWLAQVMRRNVVGASSLLHHWHTLSTLRSKLTPTVFLAGRSRFVERMDKWITGPAVVLEVHTWSPDDLRDATAAWWAQRVSTNALPVSAVALRTFDAWSYLIKTQMPLLLLVEDGFDLSPEQLTAATAQGHYVLLRTTTAQPRGEDCVLGELGLDLLGEALRQTGIESGKAWQLARDAAGSGVVLKRLLAGRSAEPPWARGAAGAKLAPVVLVGDWDGSSPRDRDRVAAIFGLSYLKVEALLVPWARANDPLVRRTGDRWRVAGRVDAWRWLAGNLTAEHCTRYAKVAEEVLGEINPRYGLRPDDRHFAAIRGAVPLHSRRLHRALAETLCFLSLRAVELSGRTKMPAVARGVIAKVLASAADWRLWASLDYALVFIAEAAPDLFLKTMEDDLVRSEPATAALFGQAGDSFFGDNPHVEVMWALQSLLWEPRWIARAVDILVKLAARDPGGNTSPRPLDVLHSAFAAWLPQCGLDVKGRCRMLDRVFDANPVIGWKLLSSLLPRLHYAGSKTHRPQYRTPEAANEEVTIEEYWEQVGHITRQLVKAAGSDLKMWQTLIEEMHFFPDDVFELILSEIRKLGGSLDLVARASLWNSLHHEVVRHQYFRKSDWAMLPPRLAKVSAVVAELEPTDPILLYGWLFGRNSLELPGTNMDTPYAEQQRLREEARVMALKKIVGAGGIELLEKFTLHVNEPNEVGYLSAKHRIWDDAHRILPGWLEDPREKLRNFAYGYARARFQVEGWSWLETLNPPGWTPATLARLSTLFPFSRATWDRIAKLGPGFTDEYWKVAHPWAGEVAATDVEYAIGEFLRLNRPVGALDALESARYGKVAVSAETVLAVLEAVKHDYERATAAGEKRELPHGGHRITEVIGMLHAKADLTTEQGRKLEQLEWFYLPILESHGAPKLLIERVRNDPAFFIDLVAMMYVTDETVAQRRRVERTEHESGRSRNAYRLLDSIRTLPGVTDGTMDELVFSNWISEVRRIAAERDYRRSCENQLGDMLLQSPIDPSGYWPCAGVCRLLTNCSSTEMTSAFLVAIFNNQGRPGPIGRTFNPHKPNQRDEAGVRLREYASKLDLEFPVVAQLLRQAADEQDRIWEQMSRDD